MTKGVKSVNLASENKKKIIESNSVSKNIFYYRFLEKINDNSSITIAIIVGAVKLNQHK